MIESSALVIDASEDVPTVSDVDTSGEERRRNKRWPEALKREILVATVANGTVAISATQLVYPIVERPYSKLRIVDLATAADPKPTLCTCAT